MNKVFDDEYVREKAYIRLLKSHRLASEMLLEMTGATIFCFDVVEDVFYFLRITPGGKRKESRIVDFCRVLKEMMQGDDKEEQRFAEAFLESARKGMEGTVEFWGRVFTEIPHWHRMTYRSVLQKDGITERVVGCSVVIDKSMLSVPGRKESRSMREVDPFLFPMEKLESEINDRQIHLGQGEKGMLFLISINNLANLEKKSGFEAVSRLLRTIMEMIQSDFREEDILVKVDSSTFALFLCGVISIDIIEKMARRIVEIVNTVKLEGVGAAKCNVGVAASGARRKRYAELFKEGEYALNLAKSHGVNNFRVYEHGMEGQ